LFFVSATSVGFEVELTRYFAIASWSEYGYWVISIVMVGFSASGFFLEARATTFILDSHCLDGGWGARFLFGHADPV
jgi:hypothetical protein